MSRVTFDVLDKGDHLGAVPLIFFDHLRRPRKTARRKAKNRPQTKLINNSHSLYLLVWSELRSNSILGVVLQRSIVIRPFGSHPVVQLDRYVL